MVTFFLIIRQTLITNRTKKNLYLIAIFFSLNAFGNDEDTSGISKNTIEQLTNHQTWLKLGHYTEEPKNQSGFKSEIKSESFFLAEDGENSPTLELIATISAFKAPVLDNNNSHAICKFPARYIWLKSHIKDLVVNNINCDEFASWKKGSVKSLSLVYATGYLGNPASFYGHTLIKFNLDKAEKSFLLDSSINFGAKVPPDENPVSYVVKGVTGGYDANFSHVDFYFHYNNYGELERRDLWEYELALSQTEVDLIVGHLWEILNKRFTYFFLDKNCAYRMAEVLELANDFNLTENLHSWVFPQTIFSNLDQHEINNENRIKNIKFHPSRQSRFLVSYSELSSKEKEFFTLAAKNISLTNSSRFNALETHEKHKLLAALNNYFNLIKKRDDLSVKLKEDIRKVHLRQLDLPTYIPNKKKQIKAPPHQSRKPSYIQISSISNKKLGQGSMIYLRPAYYDSLDADNGHLPFSTLTMMGIKLAYQNNKLYLRSLDFVDINSVSIAKSGLPGDEGKVWNISAGIHQQNLSCIDCPIFRLQGGIGRSKKISDNTIFGVGIGAGIQNSRNQYGFGYVKSTIFANFSLDPRNRFLFKAENRHHLASNVKDEIVYSLESRWKVSDNFDVRLGYKHDASTETNISFGYYW